MSTVKEQMAQVANFMKVAGQDTHTKQVGVGLGVANLRYSLITEEITGKNEFAYCAERDDLVGMLDGMCDILYVVYGAALTFGVSIMEPINENADEITAHSKANGKLAPAHITVRTIEDLKYDALEFKAGYKAGDYTKIRTTLSNIVKEVYMYSNEIQVDLIGAFDEVHKSNMSKFASTKEEAEAAIATRQAQGDEKYQNVYVAGVTVEGVEHWMVKRSDDHKILKCLGFFEPDLKKFVK